MRFRTGLIVGFAVGYVLGAKAGRERYDQIQSAFSSVSGNKHVDQVVTKGKEAMGVASDRARDAMSNGFHEASRRMREAAEGSS